MAKMIIIENKGSGPVTATPIDEAGIATGIVRLLPGINFLEASVYDTLKTEWKYKFDSNNKDGFRFLHIDKDAKGLKCSIDFAKLEMNKAEDLIKSLYDLNMLKALRANDVRDSIRAKLANQIEAIENYTVNKNKEASD